MLASVVTAPVPTDVARGAWAKISPVLVFFGGVGGWWWVVTGEGKVKGAGSLGSLWNSGAGARLAKQLARGRWLAVPGRLCGVCSVVSYSPAPWRVQYHRRCQA